MVFLSISKALFDSLLSSSCCSKIVSNCFCLSTRILVNPSIAFLFDLNIFANIGLVISYTTTGRIARIEAVRLAPVKSDISPNISPILKVVTCVVFFLSFATSTPTTPSITTNIDSPSSPCLIIISSGLKSRLIEERVKAIESRAVNGSKRGTLLNQSSTTWLSR